MATLWFCIVAILIAAYVVLDGFDLGAGLLLLILAKSGSERALVLKSIGAVWSGNEVFLVATGGVLFCSFPTLYASSFSGLYLPLMIVLWLLILRGISIELRTHSEAPLWKPMWDTVFGGASALLALVFGVALGNIVRGVQLDANGFFFLPLWTNFKATGRPGVFDWYTLLVGITALCALAVHGCLWVAHKTSGEFQGRARSLGKRLWWASLAATVVMSFASFAVQPNLSRQVLAHHLGVIFPIAALSGLIGMRLFSARERDAQAFLASCVYLIGMLTSAAFGVFPNVLPSIGTPDLSLTIFNAAASEHGLITALYWFIPGLSLIVLYTVSAYRRSAGKVA
jgi:cytochrome d ubiquinol oxidase subunit II